MIPHYSQRDIRWKNTKIGNSITTVGKDGCTLTCIAMLTHWANGKTGKDPDWTAKNLVYTVDGKILWKSVSLTGSLVFFFRNYIYNQKKIEATIKSENDCCILEIEWRNGSKYRHWILPYAIDGDTLKCIDPINGKVIQYNALGSNGIFGYGKCTGFSILRKWQKV